MDSSKNYGERYPEQRLTSNAFSVSHMPPPTLLYLMYQMVDHSLYLHKTHPVSSFFLPWNH